MMRRFYPISLTQADGIFGNDRWQMEIQAADRDRLSSGPPTTDPINARTFDVSSGISDEDGLSVLPPVGSNPAIVSALLLTLAMASTWVLASVLDWPAPRRSFETRQLDSLETASSAPQHGSATPVTGGRQRNTAVLIEPKRSAPRAKQSIEAPRKRRRIRRSRLHRCRKVGPHRHLHRCRRRSQQPFWVGLSERQMALRRSWKAPPVSRRYLAETRSHR